MIRCKLILVVLVGVFTLSGCATVSRQSYCNRAAALYREGNIEEAYKIIEKAYEENSDNTAIKNTYERIKSGLIEKYLNEAKLSSDNVFMKHSILLKAIELDRQRDDIKMELLNDEKEIEALNKSAQRALKENDIFEAFKQFFPLNKYEVYSENVKQLKDKLINNESSLLSEIDELARKGEENQALLFYLVAKKLFPKNTDLDRKIEKLLLKKSEIAFSLAKDYEKINNNDRVATSFIYLLLTWNYNQDTPDLVDRIREQFKKFQNTARPKLIVDFAGNFSDSQKNEILSFLGAYKDSGHIESAEEKKDGYEFLDGDIILSLSLSDLSVDTKHFQSAKYSKYLAGYQTVPNAEYDQVRFQYEQAVQNARQAQYNYALNPNLGTALAKGIAEGVMNGLASRVAQTPSYIQQPVYKDYQYGQVDFNHNLNIKVKYKISEARTNLILKESIFENSDCKRECVVSGAHPQDSSGIINRQASSPEEVLKAFCNSSFDGLSKFIVYELIDKHNILEAYDALKKKNYGQVIDRVFNFKISKWLIDNDLTRSGSLDDKIGKISQDLNIINIKDALNKFNPSEYLVLDLSLRNIFRSSFNNKAFLSDELDNLKEAFEIFDATRFEYKKAFSFPWVSQGRDPAEKVTKKDQSVFTPKIPSNMIEECLPSVVIIETPQGTGSGCNAPH